MPQNSILVAAYEEQRDQINTGKHQALFGQTIRINFFMLLYTIQYIKVNKHTLAPYTGSTLLVPYTLQGKEQISTK